MGEASALSTWGGADPHKQNILQGFFQGLLPPGVFFLGVEDHGLTTEKQSGMQAPCSTTVLASDPGYTLLCT